jgi:hypothetical protein
MIIYCKALQFWNAYDEIVVTLGGIVIDEKSG